MANLKFLWEEGFLLKLGVWSGTGPGADKMRDIWYHSVKYPKAHKLANLVLLKPKKLLGYEHVDISEMASKTKKERFLPFLKTDCSHFYVI